MPNVSKRKHQSTDITLPSHSLSFQNQNNPLSNSPLAATPILFNRLTNTPTRVRIKTAFVSK